MDSSRADAARTPPAPGTSIAGKPSAGAPVAGAPASPTPAEKAIEDAQTMLHELRQQAGNASIENVSEVLAEVERHLEQSTPPVGPAKSANHSHAAHEPFGDDISFESPESVETAAVSVAPADDGSAPKAPGRVGAAAAHAAPANLDPVAPAVLISVAARGDVFDSKRAGEALGVVSGPAATAVVAPADDSVSRTQNAPAPVETTLAELDTALAREHQSLEGTLEEAEVSIDSPATVGEIAAPPIELTTPTSDASLKPIGASSRAAEGASDSDHEPATSRVSASRDTRPSHEPADTTVQPADAARGSPLLVQTLKAILQQVNYPLRLVPAGLRPVLDWTALSLMFWVPVVWLMVWRGAHAQEPATADFTQAGMTAPAGKNEVHGDSHGISSGGGHDAKPAAPSSHGGH